MKFHYPSLARYTCHNTGFCCRSFNIPVTKREHSRLEKMPLLKKYPELEGVRYIKPGFTGTQFSLVPDKSGACHFLDEDNLCKIHKGFGSQTKPVACQIYPYTFVQSPVGVHVGLKFSCPSAAGFKGVPLEEDASHIEGIFRSYAKTYEVPVLSDEIDISGRSIPWKDLAYLEGLLQETLGLKALPFSRRLHLALEVFDLISKSLGKDNGQKRRKFWRILAEGSWNKAQKSPEIPPAKLPSAHRKIFLQLVFYFSQSTVEKDVAGFAFFKKFKTMVASMFQGLQVMYSVGKMRLPYTNQNVSLRQVQKKMTHLDNHRELEEMLQGYFVTKLEGKGFFGPVFFNYSFSDGFQCLALMYSVLLWYTWAYAIADERDEPQRQDLIYALRCVDFNYGASPVFMGISSWLRRYCVSRLNMAQNLIASTPPP